MQRKVPAKGISRKMAMIAANEFLIFRYPTMFTAGLPRRLPLGKADLWVVPIVLTHPNDGILGEAGFVAVEAASGKIVGSTLGVEVVAAGKQLREAKGHALEAAVFRSGAV